MTRETYKGRRLTVKRGREWGTLVSLVNGETFGTATGRDEAAEMVSLRRWIDAADERRLTEPDAYPAYWYVGAPTGAAVAL